MLFRSLGRGQQLDDFEGGVASWTSFGNTLTSDSVTFLVGSKSAKMVANSTPFSISTTQSFGDLSAYSGAASGAPITGTLGIWVYLAAATAIQSVSLKVGSSASNYTQVSGVKGGYASKIAGWNYYVFKLKDGSTVGNPNWTAVSYAFLNFVSSVPPTIYADYFTIGKGDSIALNGIGRRVETPTAYVAVPAV